MRLPTNPPPAAVLRDMLPRQLSEALAIKVVRNNDTGNYYALFIDNSRPSRVWTCMLIVTWPSRDINAPAVIALPATFLEMLCVEV